MIDNFKISSEETFSRPSANKAIYKLDKDTTFVIVIVNSKVSKAKCKASAYSKASRQISWLVRKQRMTIILLPRDKRKAVTVDCG